MLVENETEASFFNREAYEAFKAHPGANVNYELIRDKAGHAQPAKEIQFHPTTIINT